MGHNSFSFIFPHQQFLDNIFFVLSFFFVCVAQQISDQDVKQIKEMFPTVDEEVVRSVLEASRGNTDQAVSNLLSMTAT